ncbi:hypothetical protein [Actinomadura montaniterrae]|uniref:Uncharacterized protein n=1 Tax=Actinomadura montaniterrae TaxID=1803903 RepID=A0A6L3VQU1_9ACTN|nr:hypothetical protein [Actinomadura montaniterrae]KAB2379145.1 hypothetical protein F9B16_21660 [Actinomadura montaniterrae]
MADEEAPPRFLLPGVLLSAGRFLLAGLRAAGLSAWCVPSALRRDEPGPAPPEPSLTFAERLTWAGLEWHVRRQKPHAGPDESARP